MPRVKLELDLKKAISGLSHKEKDKLLYRLIAKDPALVARLNFELIETPAGVTKEERREEVAKELLHSLEINQSQYYSPGYLLLDLRHLSGEINRHVRTTKDKYGDIYLNFLMLNTAFRLHGHQLRTATYHSARTFNDYVIKRALRLLKQLSKLHEDHVLDFEEAMKALGNHIGSSDSSMKAAIFHGLDVNWFLRGEVPS